jgi:hypothetical protein
VEAALAAANEKVAAGRLDAAAAALEAGTEGTAAARAVAGWVADARERQRLEMAVSVLRSHAACRRVQPGVDRNDASQLFCNVTLVCFREVSR